MQQLDEELKDALREEDIQTVKDKQASIAWRALRLAKSHDIRLFTEDVTGGNLKIYLEV